MIVHTYNKLCLIMYLNLSFAYHNHISCMFIIDHVQVEVWPTTKLLDFYSMRVMANIKCLASYEENHHHKICCNIQKRMEHFAWENQKEFLCYKCHVAQYAIIALLWNAVTSCQLT